MSQNDGGAAFARPYSIEECGARYSYHDAQNGISMRDYFAAQALPALLQADGTHHFSERANEAYQIADAMLAAREAK